MVARQTVYGGAPDLVAGFAPDGHRVGVDRDIVRSHAEESADRHLERAAKLPFLRRAAELCTIDALRPSASRKTSLVSNSRNRRCGERNGNRLFLPPHLWCSKAPSSRGAARALVDHA